MGTPTTVQLGAWDVFHDTFVAHAASPTNAVINLNDGVTWTLVDKQGGTGTALEWSPAAPETTKTFRPGVPGERITTRTYKNREVAIRLYLGPTTTWAAFSSALHNLIQTCEGISPWAPGCLQIQTTTASTPIYADILEAHVAKSYQELLEAQLQDDGVVVVCTIRPFLRGPRVTLQNLVTNPGFEAPASVGVSVFTDPLTNLQAYATVAGSSPTQDVFTFADTLRTIAGSSLMRYYRMNESGTTAYDCSANGTNGTYSGGVSSTSGLLTGDTDAAQSFNGTSGYMSSPSTVLPSGNSSWTLLCLFNLSGTPGTVGMLAEWGVWGTSNQYAFLDINSSRVVTGGIGGAINPTSSALSTGTTHLVALTWDGATQKLYIDNGAATTHSASAAALGTGNLLVGAANSGSPTDFFPGTIDEVALVSFPLTSTQIGTLYTAATTTPASTANTMKVPSSSRIQFGAAQSGAIALWQVRFRMTGSNAQANFYLHYQDANDQLYVQVNTNALVIKNTVAGVTTSISTASNPGSTVAVVSGIYYWLQIYQYPSVAGVAQYVQCNLFNDVSGAASGSAILACPLAATTDYQTVPSSLNGPMQISAVSGTLGIGGNFTAVHVVQHWGPGGWYFVPNSGSATTQCAGCWLTTPFTATYPNGPVTSAGAVQSIFPSGNGSWDCLWYTANQGSAGSIMSTAYPVTSGITMQASIAVTATGLGVHANLQIMAYEYNSSGTTLRSTAIATLAGTGSPIAWTTLAGSWTTGANCAYVILGYRAVDTSGTNTSGGAVVTWDNALWWNQTTTGQSTMPYCELNFPVSPASLMISGVTGDVPSPCLLALALWPASLSLVTTNAIRYAVGRRSISTTVFQPISLQVGAGVQIDTSSYGGYYITTTGATANPNTMVTELAYTQGTYHLFTRYRTTQTSGNWKNITVQNQVYSSQSGAATPQNYGVTYGPLITPTTLATSRWIDLDCGIMILPPIQGALINPYGIALQPGFVVTDTTGNSPTQDTGWQALIPLDGGYCAGTFNNTSGNGTISNNWIWAYIDGIGLLANRPAALSYNLTPQPIPAPSIAYGGPGTASSATANLNGAADDCLFLDPNLLNGVNQLVAYTADNAGNLANPIFTEIRYEPLYLYPN